MVYLPGIMQDPTGLNYVKILDDLQKANLLDALRRNGNVDSQAFSSQKRHDPTNIYEVLPLTGAFISRDYNAASPTCFNWLLQFVS